ncbi:glycosyltransferase [Demequina sp. NBRC 110054]|uniref:glycosyltransferase n=1 Tax=Demequina sp. NBRC 110054 TaxID=1570343 RepID=UPI001F3E6BE6|nr:glycosyltransferase [Demequina sp. NBRC 110054]
MSPDGAYGGPVRVAVNQLAELARRGHEVELIAGCRGFGSETPREEHGVRLSLFPVSQRVPGSGFAGLASSELIRYVRGSIDETTVVQVHLARDLITMPAARIARARARRLVIQPHGMIAQSGNPLAPFFDLALTRRVLRNADAVLSLTADETRSIESIAGPGVALSRIHNGIPVPGRELGEPEPLEVLFLSRLHPRKRAPLFVEMAIRLAGDHPQVRFAVVGPDEGDGDEVAREIRASGLSAERLSWEGSLPPADTAARMARAAIYVLPSIGEVFPMSVLEAMGHGKAVVVTEDNGLASLLKARDSGVVVDESVEGLVDAVRRLIEDPLRRQQLGRNARAHIESEFSISSVVDRLEVLYA